MAEPSTSASALSSDRGTRRQFLEVHVVRARTHALRRWNCTRCYDPLPEDRVVFVEDLWESNFLGRRIVRGHEQNIPRFRLKCEELMRSRREFLGPTSSVIKDISSAKIIQSDVWPKRLDMLSGDDAMEVGIYIGSLNCLQANMPPQRFNYQQRVGRRAGEIKRFRSSHRLRGRSHDAFYFRHPESITAMRHRHRSSP